MQSLFVIESRGQRVLTSAQIADCYNTTVDCIKQNFHANRNRYIEGKHYIALTGSELREFKNKVRIPDPVKNESKNEVRISHPAEIKARYQFDTQFKYAKSLYLWTEKGALLHAKSLNTDKAWEVYDYLVDFYFRAKEQPQITQTKPEPVKKTSGREVVDIPENADIQAAIQEVHKQLVAMDSVLKAYNRYQSKENYLHLESVLELLWHETGRKIINLMDVEPNLVVKPGY